MGISVQAAPNAAGPESRTAADSATQKTPKGDIATRYAEAEELFRSGKYPEAQALFSQIKSDAGSYRETESYLARIKREMGADAASPRGGQGSAVPAAGGLSGAEKVSRLLIDGRKAFQDGDLAAAKTRFENALEIDGSNSDARKYLGEIDRLQGGASLKPAVASDGAPPKLALRFGKGDAAAQTAKAPAPAANKKGGPVTQAVESPVVAKASVSGELALALAPDSKTIKSDSAVQQFLGPETPKPVKPTAPPVADKKAAETKKAEVSAKPEPKAAEAPKQEVKKEEPKKVEAQKVEAQKAAEAKKEEPKKAEAPAKEETKKAEAPKEPEAKKEEPKKAEAPAKVKRRRRQKRPRNQRQRKRSPRRPRLP